MVKNLWLFLIWVREGNSKIFLSYFGVCKKFSEVNLNFYGFDILYYVMLYYYFYLIGVILF